MEDREVSAEEYAAFWEKQAKGLEAERDAARRIPAAYFNAAHDAEARWDAAIIELHEVRDTAAYWRGESTRYRERAERAEADAASLRERCAALEAAATKMRAEHLEWATREWGEKSASEPDDDLLPPAECDCDYCQAFGAIMFGGEYDVPAPAAVPDAGAAEASTCPHGHLVVESDWQNGVECACPCDWCAQFCGGRRHDAAQEPKP